MYSRSLFIMLFFFCNVPLTEIKFPNDIITQEVTSCLLGKHFINFNAVLSTSLDLLNIQLVNSRQTTLIACAIRCNFQHCEIVWVSQSNLVLFKFDCDDD